MNWKMEAMGKKLEKILGISSRNGKQQVILLILLMTCCDATKMTMKKMMFDLQPTYIYPQKVGNSTAIINNEDLSK